MKPIDHKAQMMTQLGLGGNLRDDLKRIAKMFRDNQDLREFLNACEQEKREALYYMLKRHLKFSHEELQPYWQLMGLAMPSEAMQTSVTQ